MIYSCIRGKINTTTMQEITIYIVLFLAVAYLLYRAFAKNKKQCAKCEGACSGIDFNKIDVGKTFNKNRSL